jgi:hypothetical protein
MMNSAVRSVASKAPKTSAQLAANIQKRFMSGKEVKFGVEGRAAILKGVDMLADAVQVRDTIRDFPERDAKTSNTIQYHNETELKVKVVINLDMKWTVLKWNIFSAAAAATEKHQWEGGMHNPVLKSM